MLLFFFFEKTNAFYRYIGKIKKYYRSTEMFLIFFKVVERMNLI